MDCAKTNLLRYNDYFEKQIWSDESKIELFDHNDATHVWREDGAAYSQKNPIPIMKHGSGNIVVCRCFANSETEELRFIDSTIKSVKYLKSLEDCLQSSVQKLELGPDWMFQQDIDPKQTA